MSQRVSVLPSCVCTWWSSVMVYVIPHSVAGPLVQMQRFWKHFACVKRLSTCLCRQFLYLWIGSALHMVQLKAIRSCLINLTFTLCKDWHDLIVWAFAHINLVRNFSKHQIKRSQIYIAVALQGYKIGCIQKHYSAKSASLHLTSASWLNNRKSKRESPLSINTKSTLLKAKCKCV